MLCHSENLRECGCYNSLGLLSSVEARTGRRRIEPWQEFRPTRPAYTLLLPSNALEWLVVGRFPVDETARIGITLGPVVGLWVVDLRPITHSTVTVSVSRRGIGCHRSHLLSQ